jgi:hypothetical protein
MAAALRLNAKTLEGQFFELVQALKARQQDTSFNPSLKEFVSSEFDPNSKTFVGTFEFPLVEKLDAQGSLVLSPEEVFLTPKTEQVQY